MRHIKKNSRDDNEIWKDMAENAVIGIYRATKKGKFLYANQKLSQIFGFNSPEQFLKAIPNIFQIYMHENRKQAMLEDLDRALYSITQNRT